MKLANVIWFAVAVSGLSYAQPTATPQPRVESFSPQGEVKDVRQVVARFSEPMVAFGDPRLPSPFDVKCEGKGSGHWVDARNWAYDFEADLPAGLKCSFMTRAKLVTQAGASVSATTYNFSTGGPAIRESWPSEGTGGDEGEGGIDEEQVFLFGLDAMADIASVREHAFCNVAGVGERVPLEIIEGDARKKVLVEQEGRARNFFEVLTKRGRHGVLAVKDDRFKDTPIVVARCARKLPAGAEVSLVWGAGIRTISGVPTSADQTLLFKVRQQFSVKQSCERVNPNAGCVPVLPISLNFTAPIDAALAAKIELHTADGKSFYPKLDERAKAVESVSFNGPFDARTEVTINLPRGLRDDAGRELANAASFPLRVRVDDDPPLVKFSSHFGILESKAQPALPVSVRNVEATMKGLQTRPVNSGLAGSAGEGSMARIDTGSDSSSDGQIATWLMRVLRPPHEQRENQAAFEKKFDRYPREGELPLLFNKTHAFKTTPLTLPRLEGERALELVGIPLPKPGFYVVEFASNRLGAALHNEKKPYYTYSSALVTNMAVHFKLGRESSLAWVTQLDNAQPVGNARLSVSTCYGTPLWSGTTDAKGIAHIDAQLDSHYDGRCSGLLVIARKDDDLSFMLTSWNEGISTWQFNLGGGSVAGAVVAHTVLDRPLFRAGETVSMKHFVRLRTGKGFAQPDAVPNKTIVLNHEGSGQHYEVPASWNGGTGVSTWAIPKEAKLGTYTIAVKLGDRTLQSGSFRVEQYRVPFMKAVLKPPTVTAVRASKVDVDAQLSYLAGGVAAGAPVKFRSRLVSYPLLYPAYDDFRFGGKAPQEGISAVQPYSYDPMSDDEEGDGETDAAPAGATGYAARTRSLTLDASGGVRVSFDGIPLSDDSRALEVEMEYSDPNGQILTSATRVLVLPSALVLGIRMEGWYATKDHMAFKVLALDASGKIQPGRKITVDAYQRKTYAYRKRLLGGFYAYEETAEIKRVGSACSGTTDQRGMLICDGAAPDSGDIILVARAQDDKGNAAVASADVYVAGEDAWFSASQSDRIDVLPDKRAYQPGDVAHFEVRMPFREATALVTVEREGVLSSMVVPISAKKPFVDVPIAKEFGPNAYVSVMVVRGRVDVETPGRFAWLRRMIYRIGMFFGLVKELPHETNTAPTALVDLTKPAFRLGMTQIKVGWQQYELKVKVEADRERYKVRDKAAVKISVTDADGKPAANAEVAIAAVDEGLLQLAAPTSWELLDAMMQRRPAEVQTSTAQSQVIGKRHFGKKAAAPGGGGGGEGANARELFDTLLLWRPSVQLDAKGEARVEVPLNDSLTAFRIEAIAHANAMQFGSASTSIRTSQEVMLFAGLPPFVREGDQFAAMLTVRNGGDRALTLDVTANSDAGDGSKPIGTQRVSIKPGEASTVSFPATVPFDAKKLMWSFAATEVASGNKAGNTKPAQDALKFVQTVGAAYPVRVYQQTLEQLEPGKALSFPVQRPAGAIPGRGGVDIRLANSLGGELGGLREWMTRYPYTCLEQRASVAVALEDSARWQAVMNSLPTYLDRDGLAKYFPMDWLQGDDTLTSYLLSISNEAGFEIPDAARERMLKGLEDFVAGRIHRYGSLQTADLVMRKLAAIDALARYDRAKPEMLQSLEIAPNLWPSSGVIDWVSLLTRMKNVPDHDRKLEEARQILKSRLMFSGTTMSFSTEKSDYLWWLMVSPELNAIRMLRLAADEPGLAPADAGRLARGALGRQKQGRWQTTVTNAWGVVALRHFKERFERDPVAGISLLKLGDVERPLDWSKAVSRNSGDPTQGTSIGDGVSAHFDWPNAVAPLSLQHQGSGKPWAFIASRASLPLDKPLFAGYSVKRTITPVEQQKSGVWQRGDTYRVTLEIDAQADMTWVVVNDPVPAGASVLGSGLGGDSKQLASGEKKTGWQRPAFEERAFDGFRAYYQYVPKGKFTVEYTVRLNNPGTFQMPATRVEAMYAPEIFAEVPVARMEVK